MKTTLLACLPGVRWTPHDIPTQDPSTSGTTSSKPRKPAPYHSRLARKIASATAVAKPNHGPPVRRRKSALSLTGAPGVLEPAERWKRTSAQAQSKFFSMLPAEVRVMIYEEVMGWGTVHLTIGAKRRFGHFVCEREGERDGGRARGRGKAEECGCRVLVGGREALGRLDRGVLALLRSCRRVYTEAIPYLYSSRLFSLLHLTHLLYLPSRLPTPRLNTIRYLRLRWAIRALPYLRRGPSQRLAYPEDTANWARAWTILAGLQGLRELCVVIVDPSRDAMWERQWLELEEELLEPLVELKVRDVEVVLPYASCGVEWDMGESGVRLRRPNRNGGEGGEEEED